MVYKRIIGKLKRYSGESQEVEELKSLGFSVLPQNKEWLINSLVYLRVLKREFNSEIRFGEELGFVDVVLEGFKFKIFNKSEFLILKEVFVDGTYNFNLNTSVNVIDIGMNVGVSSLFFAGKANVDSVFSFEPVDETFNDALANIKLNPNLANKIKPFNQGLYSCDTRMKFKFNPANKGSFGFVGNEKFKEGTFTEKEVELRDIKDILQNTLDDKDYVVKMDCEGAEYDLIPEILKTEKLPILLMIEWHLSRGEEIVEQLSQKGYTVIFNRMERTAGIIYAFLN